MCGSFKVSDGEGSREKVIAKLVAAINVLERSTPGTPEDSAAVESVGEALISHYGTALIPAVKSMAWQDEHGDSNGDFVDFVRAELAEIRAAA